MGVSGLLTHCLNHQDDCTETVDLIQVAKEENGIELLVDFYAFEHYVLKQFWIGLSQLRGNDYLRICGGEYGSLDAYLTKLVEDLKSCDISLVFYIDAGKGSSTEALRKKLNTWTSRHENDIKNMKTILSVCQGATKITDLPLDVNIRPVLLEDQFITALIRCSCELNQCAAGEADPLLARGLNDREHAYAVLSNDSDFCVIKDSRFIPMQLFDIDNDLHLGEAAELPEKPVQLKAKVVTMEKVISMFNFETHGMLIDMAIVSGNDFTSSFMRYLYRRLDIQGRRSIENTAQWMRRYKCIENHELLTNEMGRNPQFYLAVHDSRTFYNLNAQPDLPPQKGYFSKLIEERVRKGDYPSMIMCMHNNFYWYRMLLEDCEYGAPSVECVLAPLRAHVYRIVLPRGEALVNEYGRSPYENLRKAGIMAVPDGAVPSINKINPGKIFQNLRHFHCIMSHMETGYGEYWFDRYGRKTGFYCYLMRYFLQLNWGQNLHVTENEFLALAALVFGRPREPIYQAVHICPTVRCVTIGNWLLDIYRHMYAMLGSLLYLRHEFPLPSEVFCGSAWVCFYMCCQDDTFRLATIEAPIEKLAMAQQNMNDILKEKKHMVGYIAKGFFHYGDT